MEKCYGVTSHLTDECLAEQRRARLCGQLVCDECFQRANQAAFTDELTKIPNRRASRLHYESLEGEVAIAVTDLNSFSNINDILGHSSGDDALRMYGGHAEASIPELLDIRQADSLFVGRLGGDELIFIFQPAKREQKDISAKEQLDGMMARYCEDFSGLEPVTQVNETIMKNKPLGVKYKSIDATGLTFSDALIKIGPKSDFIRESEQLSSVARAVSSGLRFATSVINWAQREDKL